MIIFGDDVQPERTTSEWDEANDDQVSVEKRGPSRAEVLMEFAGQKVVVTGAAGFLGQHLVQRIAGSAREVCCIARPPFEPPYPGPENVGYHDVNLRDYRETLAFFEAHRPQVVYHLASASGGSVGIDNVLPHLEDDIVTTVACLTAAQKVQVRRFIVPGSTDEPPALSGIPIVAESPYALAKMTCVAYGRMFHKLYGTPVVVCRIFMTYGPHQKRRKIVPYIIGSLLAGSRPRVTSPRRLVDWIFVDDVIDALVLAGITPAIEGSTIELGSGSLVSIGDLAERIASLIPGAPAPEIDDQSEYGSNRAANLAAASRYLNWCPRVPLQQGLVATVDWHRKRHN